MKKAGYVVIGILSLACFWVWKDALLSGEGVEHTYHIYESNGEYTIKGTSLHHPFGSYTWVIKDRGLTVGVFSDYGYVEVER